MVGGDMKIKKVCELTGLSDRAVRFYIEQELIEPACKENYLGRKSYDFCDADVELLKNISVLRKFGFTLVEIKLLLLDSNNSISILPIIHERKLYQRDIDAEAFYALSRLDDKREYTLSEIALSLREPSNLLPPSKDGLEKNIKNIVSWVLIGVSLLLGILSVRWLRVYSFIKKIMELSKPRYLYFDHSKLIPVIGWIAVAVIVFVLIILFRNKLEGFVLKVVPVILCLISVIIAMRCFAEMPFYSHNEEFENYKMYDKESGLNEKGFQKRVFPEKPLNLNKDAEYSYTFIDDSSAVDLYAEWTVDEETFEREVERVLAFYDEAVAVYKDEFYVYEKNGYVCYVFFYETRGINKGGTAYFDSENNKYIDVTDQIDIFVADARRNFGFTGFYACGIFAYNEETNNLRYSYCRGFDDFNSKSFVTPRYTQVEW